MNFVVIHAGTLQLNAMHAGTLRYTYIPVLQLCCHQIAHHSISQLLSNHVSTTLSAYPNLGDLTQRRIVSPDRRPFRVITALRNSSWRQGSAMAAQLETPCAPVLPVRQALGKRLARLSAGT